MKKSPIQLTNGVVHVTYDDQLNQATANVKWDNDVEQVFTHRSNQCGRKLVFMLPAPSKGFYYLHDHITHVIDDTTQKNVIISDSKHEGFDGVEEDDLFYFSSTNVLMITFLDGDHDYFWWWNLSQYDQPARFEDPCYYNGHFNASLFLRKANERYAIGTIYGESDEHVGDEDEDEDEEWDEDRHSDTMTIIFDTKTMKLSQYDKEELMKLTNSTATETVRVQQDNLIKLLETDQISVIWSKFDDL